MEEQGYMEEVREVLRESEREEREEAALRDAEGEGVEDVPMVSCFRLLDAFFFADARLSVWSSYSLNNLSLTFLFLHLAGLSSRRTRLILEPDLLPSLTASSSILRVAAVAALPPPTPKSSTRNWSSSSAPRRRPSRNWSTRSATRRGVVRTVIASSSRI